MSASSGRIIVTPEERLRIYNEAKALWDQGKSIREAAKEVGINSSTLLTWRKKMKDRGTLENQPRGPYTKRRNANPENSVFLKTFRVNDGEASLVSEKTIDAPSMAGKFVMIAGDQVVFGQAMETLKSIFMGNK